MLVTEAKGYRSAAMVCRKYLSSEELSVSLIGIKLCIDDEKYKKITDSATALIHMKKSELGMLVAKWGIVELLPDTSLDKELYVTIFESKILPHNTYLVCYAL